MPLLDILTGRFDEVRFMVQDVTMSDVCTKLETVKFSILYSFFEITPPKKQLLKLAENPWSKQ